MKRISLITLHTPTRENVRGASALPFHLIANRPGTISIKVYTFNLNKIPHDEIKKIEIQLDVKISLLPINFYCKILRSQYLGYNRIFTKFPTLHFLDVSKSVIHGILKDSDYLWIYGEDIAHLSEKFNRKMQCVVTTPDCEALYYNRVISSPSKIVGLYSLLRYSKAYSQYINIARNMPIDNVCYHLVGKADKEFLCKVNPLIKAKFIRHPHYEGNITRLIKFHKPKIKLLISGRCDFYCIDGIMKAIKAISQAEELRYMYAFTFQGKGWEKCIEILKNSLFDVESIGYVDSYKEELCRHDVLLSAITLGTGTKGKVLDAFINGLLVIGSRFSTENIKIENGKDFFLYENVNQLIDVLRYIANHIEECEKIAKSGRNSVLKYHNIKDISNRFYNLFNG